MKEKGLNITLKNNYKPIVLSCGDEVVEIRKSKRDSANCRVINIQSSKDVDILTPSTGEGYLSKIEELEAKLEKAEAFIEDNHLSDLYEKELTK